MTRKDRRYLIILALLAVIGALLAGISLFQHTGIKYGMEAGKSFCNISARVNCDAVNQSAWAQILGIPVAAYGVGYYAVIFVSVLLMLESAVVPFLVASGMLLLATFFSAIFSIYLFIVAEFVIGSLCILCVAMYLVNFIQLILVLRLTDSRSFSQRIFSGIRSVLSGVRKFFAFKSETGGSAWLVRYYTATVLIAAFAAYSLPEFFLVKFIYARDQEQEIARLSTEELSRWLKSRKSDLKPVLEGSVLETDFYKGSASAPIELVEFSDFECPACRQFSAGLVELISEYSSNLRIVFKNFPLDNACNSAVDREFHKHACNAAEAARCAGEQGKFWEMTDFLFSAPEIEADTDINTARAAIDEGADSLGLDVQAFKECLNSDRQLARVKSDIEQGNALGIEGTPAVWVNGKRIEVVHLDVLRTIFNAILSGSK